MTEARLLAACPAVLYVVYTPGPEAEAKGYEPWLVEIDNPFFNAIPGMHHYANWKLDRVLAGEPPYAWFDFQGLAKEADLERVWFNPDLDRFRIEWVRLWGYGMGKPPAVQANGYLMRPVYQTDHAATRFALVTGGTGAPPAGADIAWQVHETIRKHFSTGEKHAIWRLPSAQENPLGLDWLAVTYAATADAAAAAYTPGAESVAFVATLVAAPE
jgi:hypothetical protein